MLHLTGNQGSLIINEQDYSDLIQCASLEIMGEEWSFTFSSTCISNAQITRTMRENQKFLEFMNSNDIPAVTE